MDLGATVCLPRNPQCLTVRSLPTVKPRGAQDRAAASHARREAAYALTVRNGPARQQVLLEQRPASLTVMPGLWELPALKEMLFPKGALHDGAPRHHAGELPGAHPHRF